MIQGVGRDAGHIATDIARRTRTEQPAAQPLAA
jgi:hypothetical protein